VNISQLNRISEGKLLGIIEVTDLTYRYPASLDPVLRDVNLSIVEGEFILLTGPSGCGKTTFCRALNGLIPHFYKGVMEGEVIIDGKSSKDHPIIELAKKVGLIFQNPDNQIFALTVEKDMAFGLENLGYPREVMKKEIDWAMGITGISNLRERATHELSGGQKQRLTIASILAMRPSVIVLDEPTSFLDPVGAEKIFNVLKKLNKNFGITIILIEHRMDLAIKYVDRIIVFNEGRVISDGIPETIFQADEIRLIGIEVPRIQELARRLRNNGIKLSSLPLTRDLMFKELVPHLEESNELNFKRKRVSELESMIKQPLIEVKNIAYTYPGGINALRDVSLTIRKGEFVSIMGENGAGKSTLVKHFNGLLKPERGGVFVDGDDITKKSVAELSRKVGLVFQNPDDQLFEEDVEQEISFALKNFGFNEETIEKRVSWALALLDIERYRKTSPFILSGGERKRVALASVLAWDPEVLVLDEPTIGQDYGQKEKLRHFLLQLRTQGKTIVVVTHDVEFVAESSPRIVLMAEGKIVSDGPAGKIMSDSKALLESSVTPSEITKLFSKLAGYGLPGDVLNVDEATEILTRRIKAGNF
jgi:energy-coupling factor transport system ATP-binding protein